MTNMGECGNVLRGQYKFERKKSRRSLLRLGGSMSLTLLLPYANHVILVGQMSSIDREIHRLYRTHRIVEILKATVRRPLWKLYLCDLKMSRKLARLRLGIDHADHTHFDLPHPIVVGLGQSDINRDVVVDVVNVVVHCKSIQSYYKIET